MTTQLRLYFQLSTCSRRAIQKETSRFGNRYIYNPRGTLLSRLARENGMTSEEVYRQLLQEREILLRRGGA